MIRHNACGMSRTRLYETYKRMIGRTNNVKDPKYEHYGGRGIKVCDEWLHDFQKFREWAYENGYDENAKRGQCTLDRINNDGNYEPSNCRFITIQEQQFNKRNNHYLVYKGERKTIKEWADTLNISAKTIDGRLRDGWDDERILSTPINTKFINIRYRKKVENDS